MNHIQQVATGKAFEYACIQSIANFFRHKTDIKIEFSPQFHTAKEFFHRQDGDLQEKLKLASCAAIRIIERLEPQLGYAVKENPLLLSIQSDYNGVIGDVRDIICLRVAKDWQIGLSCKHNHHAVKHSRLSQTIDFGKEWFGHNCSQQYFHEIKPIFEELNFLRKKVTWNSIPDKAERFYLPILNSFVQEIKRLASIYDDVPQKLIQYMLGCYDFYKVITDDGHRTTRVEAINLFGTLNRPAGDVYSIVKIPRIKFPKIFYHIDLKPNSANTVIVACDEGWNLSMRIHNASTYVEPSLKFDVQLISLPSSIHAQVEPW